MLHGALRELTQAASKTSVQRSMKSLLEAGDVVRHPFPKDRCDLHILGALLAFCGVLGTRLPGSRTSLHLGEGKQ